ncbi:anti-sigma factor [Pedobacter sp.]|uniref:anti-sigma factor n=1 Tax=Pedobacter sp. TaxID=1411316 RepID=UPI002BA139B4|nr:anti-sigma factor [Pedobacter sp.]HWW43268.1 anti-sigma factor [Pedobacter sp.]
MEEVRAYIESGILELYVLGQLSAEEQGEVEGMAAKYAEIRKEIEAIEIAMETYAISNAVLPSEGLDLKVLSAIELLKTPEEAPSPVMQVPDKTVAAPIQTPLVTLAKDSRIRSLRIALAACAALLLISLVALYSARHELSEAQNQILALNKQNQSFAATVGYMKQNTADLQKLADMPADPNWKTVKLAGTKMDPSAKMVVYWHTTGKHVMVDNSKMALPANDQNHQYQLWALVKGKPVDLGVFDVKPDTAHILLNMKEISGAQAFAVTLEKRGGSVSPTMNQMIAMGGVSI